MRAGMSHWEICTGGKEDQTRSVDRSNLANDILFLSFKTGRYLGSEGEQVRETRVLNLPLSTVP